MAAMSDADKAKVARIFARKYYNGNAATAAHDSIVSAVTALDDAYENVPTLLTNQLSPLKTAISQELPEPFASAASASLKAALHVVYTVVKFGVDVKNLSEGN